MNQDAEGPGGPPEDKFDEKFREWLQTGDYLNTTSIGASLKLAFLAGIKTGADLIQEMVETEKAELQEEVKHFVKCDDCHVAAEELGPDTMGTEFRCPQCGIQWVQQT